VEIGWLVERAFGWIAEDWRHLMKAKRTALVLLLVAVWFGGHGWAVYLSDDPGRLSNYALRHNTIEFSSKLLEFADSVPDQRDVTKFEAEYAKTYRATAIELREALEPRVCADYLDRQAKLGQTYETQLDVYYDEGFDPGAVAGNLEAMANDLCWGRSIAPRVQAIVLR